MSPVITPYISPMPNPPSASTTADPASMITRCPASQRSRGRSVDSSGSTRPAASSARGRRPAEIV